MRSVWPFCRRLPQVSLGSCVYPYGISLLRIPVTDRDFWFSGWIATAENFREYRTPVPTRPYMYGDTYPQNAGVFGTYHRKLGSMWEPGALRAAISGSDGATFSADGVLTNAYRLKISDGFAICAIARSGGT